jgi:hypothetical protein
VTLLLVLVGVAVETPPRELRLLRLGYAWFAWVGVVEVDDCVVLFVQLHEVAEQHGEAFGVAPGQHQTL